MPDELLVLVENIKAVMGNGEKPSHLMLYKKKKKQ